MKRHWFVFAISAILFLAVVGLIAGNLLVSSFTASEKKAADTISHQVPRQPDGSDLVPIHSWKQGAKIEIPVLKVSAPIEEVGVHDGNMDVPRQNQWTGVGWYKFGPFPGEVGSAVFDGHLDRPGGVPAVFWDLKQLHVNDEIRVINPGEKPLRFRVRDLQYYSAHEAPLSKIFGDTTGSYLNLITCAGEWVPALNETTLRLVVYTELVK